MKYILLFIVLCLFVGQGKTQNIEANLSKWATKIPIEKIYLQSDRDNYYAGETVWLKVYILSDHLPSYNNSVVYVELLNNKNIEIRRKTFASFTATANVQIELPDSLPTGTYSIRAYTPLMLNFEHGYLFNKTVKIYGRSNDEIPFQDNSKRTISLQFFPESGNFIQGVSNRIAFKATTKDGFPLNITGVINDQNNKKITEFKSLHDGMGYFNLVPQSNHKYKAIINIDNEDTSFSLPACSPNGIAFTVTDSLQNKKFSIQQKIENPTFKAAYMIGQMQHKVIIKQNLTYAKETFNGFINTKNLPSGVLHLTIFNIDGIPLAERLTFINNKEYILQNTFLIDTFTTEYRKKNHFSIELKDTITGDFSVSVTDADYEEDKVRSTNIYSSLLLSSDIPGYIHNPSYYFTSDDTNAIDLIMMTNGWRRFKWDDVTKNTLPEPIFKDPGFISISGNIRENETKRNFANKDVFLWIASEDSSKTNKLIHTDEKGNFKADSLIFWGNAKLMFSDIKGSKSQYIDAKILSDPFRKNYSISKFGFPYGKYTEESKSANNKMAVDYDIYKFGQGKLLENVTVKSKYISKKQEVEEKYTTGFFRDIGGIYSESFDLLNEPRPGMDLTQYVKNHIPAMRKIIQGIEANLIKMSSKEQDLNVFIDESLSSLDALNSYKTEDIALIKFFRENTYTSIVLKSFNDKQGPILSVYTKKGKDLLQRRSTTSILKYSGYDITKEFYSPVYSVSSEKKQPDQRLTLFWEPNYMIENIKTKLEIPFYNNDRTKRFKVVAEGITSEGKLLMVEKIVEAQN